MDERYREVKRIGVESAQKWMHGDHTDEEWAEILQETVEKLIKCSPDSILRPFYHGAITVFTGGAA